MNANVRLSLISHKHGGHRAVLFCLSLETGEGVGRTTIKDRGERGGSTELASESCPSASLYIRYILVFNETSALGKKIVMSQRITGKQSPAVVLGSWLW